METDNPVTPNTGTAAETVPEPNPAPEPAQPPPYQPPDRSKLRLNFFVRPDIQEKLIKHHSAMAQPGATTTYFDQNGDEVTRTLKPRETLRHAQELHNFSKLNLGQQKLDAAIAQQNGENKPTSLNQFVNESVGTAADRLLQEAYAQGLQYVAELPDERVAEVYEEEKRKYDAEHPEQSDRCQKKPFAIPPEQRNDWIIPQETQNELMDRLVDMALPEGAEYKRIKPRARLMASRLIGRFCRLGQQQQFLDLRVHSQQPEIDGDELVRELHELNRKALEARRKDDEEFYKTHERNERPWPPRPKTEN
jgi:hypothetical protein